MKGPPGAGLDAAVEMAPVVWQPADAAVWERVVAGHEVDTEVEGLDWVDYGGEVVATLFDALGGWIQTRVSVELLDTLVAVLLWGLLLLLVGLVVALTFRWVALWRGRSVPMATVRAATPSRREEAGLSAEQWWATFSRAVAAGEIRPALEALWWFAALRLAPSGLDESWTTDELVVATAGIGAETRRSLELIDRGLYGPQLRGIDEVAQLGRRVAAAVGSASDVQMGADRG